MADLYIPDYPSETEESATGLLLCNGDDIDFGSCEEDAVVEITAVKECFRYTPMCEYGYTWNLEEAKQIHAFLDMAIREAEAK